MKYGVIDVGSNSVRLMIWRDGTTLFKRVKITKLGEGISLRPYLTDAAQARTLAAINDFVAEAKLCGADEIYAFATAAVRSAENGKLFAESVFDKTGVKLDIVSGETEASLGLKGALCGRDGGIIDIGGASTEITVSHGGKTVYSYSLGLGTVRLNDTCGQDREKIEITVADRLKEYGEIPAADFYGIGGTATSLAAVDLALDPYDPNRTHGHRLYAARVKEIADKLISTPVEERKKLKGLQPERAEVIAGGALLLSGIMAMLKTEYVTVSESDNLEGYLLYKLSDKGRI